MILVGDIHGQFHILQKILDMNKDTVIQLGDLGIGFPAKKINPLSFFDLNQPYTISYLTNFEHERLKFLRGNHDSPKLCKKHPNYLGDYGMFNNMFFVSGAWSIDREFRKEGVDWWADEELSIIKLNKMLTLYEKEKPEIVITHDCPQRILSIMYSQIHPTRTGQALDSMMDIHLPKYFYFAHHHKSFTYVYKNICTFQCLNSNEVTTI